MAQTPTDPTKAQVWKTGTPENPKFEFYIPRGAKGEPGGIVLGTDIGTVTSANDLKISGVYRLPSTQNGLVARGFPRDTDSGVLTVYERVPAGTTAFQEWRSMSQQYRMLYVRTWDGGAGSWTAWKCIPSQRVDTTAGRAIYTWDDVNNREQLTYGDTGWRDVTADSAWTSAVFPPGVVTAAGYAVRIRRIGYNVELHFGIDKAAGGPATASSGIPLGFRPASNAGVQFIGATSGLAVFRVFLSGGTNPLIIQSPAAISGGSVTMTFSTYDPWPTALPGVSLGVIPNL